MHDKNTFGLVPKPPSAVEMVKPGKRRILSGMVTDALDLAKTAEPPRIIALDDEQMLLDLYELIIRPCFNGATVLTFGDGEQARQEMFRTTPDLLIMDMNRSGLAGCEMLPLLAANKVKFPILVASGTAEENFVRQCAGPELNVSFLAKPFLVPVFYHILIKFLATKVPQSQAQYDLGLSYLNGTGLIKDLVEAYRWFRLAAESGHKSASEAINSTQALLTPGQLQEGERRYREHPTR